MGKKVGRKLLSFIISFCMLLVGLPVFAGEIKELTSADLVDGVLDLSSGTWSDTTIRIPASVSKIVIRGNTEVTYSNLSIEAVNGTEPLDVVIQDVNIQGGYIDIARNSSSNTLHIVGSNKVVASGSKAAICVRSGKTLTIDAKNSNQSLTAVGGSGAAGIGANDNMNNGTGNIIIKNGKITATGNNGGAGIGQCHQPNGNPSGNISILGGIIKATGSEKAAGIGGSNNGQIGNISISGATVTATGGNEGAGIGAGTKKCGDITIKDGSNIEATGGSGAAGIGGGNGSEATVGNITIDKAIVKAYGGTGDKIGGAGIGGGNQSSFNLLTIKGDAIIDQAKGGYGSAGIGSGSASGGSGTCEIVIDGATINEAIGGDTGAGIGGGNQRGCKITIKGDSTLIKLAKGGEKAAGIGSGPIGDPNLGITISGGKIQNAIGGDYGAGIGGGENRGQKIEITGGYIENAQGGKEAAGIGGGKAGQEGSVTMSGGIVYAQAGAGADNAIGAGKYPSGSENEETKLELKVSGGDVFLNGDAKGFIPGDYDKVFFKLYSDWANKIVHSNKEFYIKEVIPVPGAMIDGKQQYDLKFNAEKGTCNDQGIFTSILKIPSYDVEKLESGDFTELDKIFHGYWFQYMDGDKIMVGHPAVNASKADWNIEVETKTVVEGGEAKTVDDFSKIKKMTIPIKFKEATSVPKPVTIGTVDKAESKIVPYSISALTFLVPTAAETNILEVKGLTVEMDFSAITSDLECNAAKIKYGIWQNGKYSSTLAGSLVIEDVGTKKIKLTYPTSMVKTDDFLISLYIPTNHFETDSSKNQRMDIYRDSANADHKLGKEEEVQVTLNLKAKVVTEEEIEIPGIAEKQKVPGSKVMNLTLPSQTVKMKYADFIKIS